LCFLSTPPAPPAIYTLSLHDALPICLEGGAAGHAVQPVAQDSPPGEGSGLADEHHKGGLKGVLGVMNVVQNAAADAQHHRPVPADRKSTRLNSSHQIISYAVFCLKKK